MKRRPIKPLTFDQLEKLSTKRLLARLKQLHQCEESLSLSDHADSGKEAGELFKDSARWLESFEQIKRLLATREHIL